MPSSASHIFWRQACGSAAESTLATTLAVLQLKFEELPSQDWDLGAGTIGGVPVPDCALLAPAADGWSVLQLPLGSPLGEPLSDALSRQSGGPALLVHEKSHTSWGYVLYDHGAAVDRFWSMPSMVEVEPGLATGHPAQFCETLGVPAAKIDAYLKHLSPDEISAERAFPDDEFTLGDPWVRVDFLRRLGLQYPSPAGRHGRHVQLGPLPPGTSDSLPVQLMPPLLAPPPPPRSSAEQSGFS